MSKTKQRDDLIKKVHSLIEEVEKMDDPNNKNGFLRNMAVGNLREAKNYLARIE